MVPLGYGLEQGRFGLGLTTPQKALALGFRFSLSRTTLVLSLNLLDTCTEGAAPRPRDDFSRALVPLHQQNQS